MKMEQAPKSNNEHLGDEIDKMFEIENENKDDSEKKSVSNEPSVEELSKKAIDEHNEEIKERKESPEEKSEEKLQEVEKPSSKVSFGNNPNLEDFKNLTGLVKEKISSVYEGMKVRFVDRANIMHNATLYAIHKEKVEKLSNNISLQDSRIENLQSGLKMHGERMKNLVKQFGELEPKAQKESDKEKWKLEKDLELAEQKKTELLLEGSYAEAQRNKYEKIKDQILEKVEKFVDEKTTPYNEKIENLKDKGSQLNVEIGALAEKRNDSQGNLNELEEMAKNAQFKFEKITYKNQIKEAKVELRDFEQGIYSLQNDQIKMDGKISGLYGRINHWNGIRDKMIVLSKGKESAKNETYSASKASGEQTESAKTKKENHGEKAWYEANQINENTEQAVKKEKAQNVYETQSYESSNINVEDNLEQREVSADEYIERWNNNFGNRLRIDDALLDILDMKKMKGIGIRKLPLKRIEEGIIEYNNSQSYFLRISKDSLKSMFKTIRDVEILGKAA